MTPQADSTGDTGDTGTAGGDRGTIVVFHRALGFVHRCIPDAVAAIDAVATGAGFAVVTTDDPDRLVAELGAGPDAVVFAQTSGDVLPAPHQRTALEAYVTGGGGFVGIHAASSMGDDVRRDWPWYRTLVGAAFVGHTAARLWCDDRFPDSPASTWAGPVAEAPAEAEELGPGLAMASCEPAVLRVEAPTSPAARGLTDGELRSDEWYGFDENPRDRVHVVATVDETTYAPALGRMGHDHPVIWWHAVGAGRSVYTSLGHAIATWHEPAFLDHVLGAIELAAGKEDP